ncbi:uncharacterized protein LOC128511721 [Clarias gariepinus]|uniref:uncharacterized protein LOC128511721 n=1 Tax=Clarias gariepinus TaxID=13013 RepID=UPI00234CF6D0|nr:uncharacterized protein LOC128511721 [Clarias gariepinus]
MEQTRRRPGPQTSRGPPEHKSSRRTTTGTAPPPRKGQRRAQRGAIQQPQCRRPRGLWQQDRRLRRRPSTPRQSGPWVQRSQGPSTPQPVPSQARRARSRPVTASGYSQMVEIYPPAEEAPSSTDASKVPAQGQAPGQAPTHIPAAHQPGPTPPRPSRNPSPEAERPQDPKPPRTYLGAVRPPGRQPTSADMGLPSSAACGS